MAVLAESGGPRPPLSTRLDLLFDRSEWLIVVPFAVILVTIVFLQGSIAGRERTDPSGTAVCEQRTFLTPNLFFLALH
jgi:hypothetical protein